MSNSKRHFIRILYRPRAVPERPSGNIVYWQLPIFLAILQLGHNWNSPSFTFLYLQNDCIDQHRPGSSSIFCLWSHLTIADVRVDREAIVLSRDLCSINQAHWLVSSKCVDPLIGCWKLLWAVGVFGSSSACRDLHGQFKAHARASIPYSSGMAISQIPTLPQGLATTWC